MSSGGGGGLLLGGSLFAVVVLGLLAFNSKDFQEPGVGGKEGLCEGGYARCGPRRLLSGNGTMVLQQVVVVHRHGDRTPLSLKVGDWRQSDALERFWISRLPGRDVLEKWGELNTDETNTHLAPRGDGSSTSWPYGHLTQLGGDQLRTLGSKLRERYVSTVNFLPRKLQDPDTIQVRSTRYPRTIQSTQNMLLGLYPEDARGLDASGGKVKIPIYTVPTKEEYVHGGHEDTCPRLRDERERVDAALVLPQRFTDALEHVTKAFQDKGSAEKVSYIRASEVNICHNAHGIPLARGVPPQTLQDLTDYNAFMYFNRGRDVAMSRLGIGPLLTDILNGLERAIDPRSKAPLLRVFSGHDSTLLPLLAALDAIDGRWPPYASYAALELLYDEKEDGHYVRLIYNDTPMPLLGGGELSAQRGVPLVDFKKGLEPRAKPENWEEECRSFKECPDGVCTGDAVVQN